MRKTKFQNDYYYYIYNRGVDKRDVFMDEKDYLRFLVSMREFNQTKPIDSLYRLNQTRKQTRQEAEPLRFALANRRGSASLVEIVCYCLNPNHYHFLLKQKKEKGIEKFMQKLGTGYTMYFNEKYKRSGSLFQGKFKSIQVKTDGYLWKLSCYINGNSEIHKIAKAEKYQWSSYQDYLGLRNGSLCNKDTILRDFKNIKEYKKLTDFIIKESKQIKFEIKQYALE